MPTGLERQVRRDLDRLGELEGKRILVACSGGPDSAALLDVLHRLSEPAAFSLGVASLDHGLRPEAGAEVALVGRLARERELAFFPGRADPAAFPAPGQAGARAARHDFLERTREEAGADLIALGHTAEDRAETVLMNLIRGAGLKGLSGMGWRSGRLIRPLLGSDRTQIMDHLARRSLPFVSDPSNQDPAYLRVRVRTRLLPLLKEENPSLLSALARLADVLEADELFLEGLARAKLEDLSTALAGALSLDRPGLAALDKALSRRVVRAALKEIKGDLRRISRDQVDSVLDLAQGAGGRVDLPEGIRAWGSGLELLLARAEAPVLAPLDPLEVDSPGKHPLSIGRVLLVERIAPSQVRDPDPLSVLLDEELIVWPLVIRPPRKGDRIRPLGMRGTKKLSDLMIDRKIPRPFRPRMVVVESGGRVLWVAGAAVSREAALSDRTRSVIRLRIRGK